ncbi:hypothetical protein LCGC14_0414500 [marine sediment metagenome]|uniref:Uncharacterized protein n=1 Tax=marine sediment metagenome TaxID=412755 RepID=A0A0F9SSR9_9ZZZZ
MTKKQAKKKLDLPQAIVFAAVVLSIAVVLGLVLTWGPEDSRTEVTRWVALAITSGGALIALARGKMFGDGEAK